MFSEKDLNKTRDVNPGINNDYRILKERSIKSQIKIKSKNNNSYPLDSEINQLESSGQILISKGGRFNKLIKEHELAISKIIIYSINESTFTSG